MRQLVLNCRIKAFTLLEMLFTMTLIILILQFVPPLLKYSQNIKQQAQELYTIDYEFFSRDLIKEFKNIDHKTISISNSSIDINNGAENIEYKLVNNKIIKVINHEGNITLLNNVVKFKAIELNEKIIKIDIIINKGRYRKNHTIYL